MDYCLLLLTKQHTDKLNEKAKAKSQETLEFMLNSQLDTSSFNPPKNLFEKRKCLLAVTSFEATISVFKINFKKDSFSISTPGQGSSRGGAGTITKLQKLLESRHKSDVDLHVEEDRKRGNQTKVKDNVLKSSELDTHKS